MGAAVCGANHTLLLGVGGEMVCFGDNARGQLGVGQGGEKARGGARVDEGELKSSFKKRLGKLGDNRVMEEYVERLENRVKSLESEQEKIIAICQGFMARIEEEQRRGPGTEVDRMERELRLQDVRRG